MIRDPKPGQLVKVAYKRRDMPLHQKTVKVIQGAGGPGPRNVLVATMTGKKMVIPRGNLFEWAGQTEKQKALKKAMTLDELGDLLEGFTDERGIVQAPHPITREELVSKGKTGWYDKNPVVAAPTKIKQPRGFREADKRTNTLLDQKTRVDGGYLDQPPRVQAKLESDAYLPAKKSVGIPVQKYTMEEHLKRKALGKDLEPGVRIQEVSLEKAVTSRRGGGGSRVKGVVRNTPPLIAAQRAAAGLPPPAKKYTWDEYFKRKKLEKDLTEGLEPGVQIKWNDGPPPKPPRDLKYVPYMQIPEDLGPETSKSVRRGIQRKMEAESLFNNPLLVKSRAEDIAKGLTRTGREIRDLATIAEAGGRVVSADDLLGEHRRLTTQQKEIRRKMAINELYEGMKKQWKTDKAILRATRKMEGGIGLLAQKLAAERLNQTELVGASTKILRGESGMVSTGGIPYSVKRLIVA
jgi:hypothetical protein